MTDNAFHLTRRELRRIVFAPRFWALLLCVAFVLGITGPFGTYESLALLPRMAYWTGIAIATYFTGVGTVYLIVNTIWQERGPGVVGYAIAGLAAGIPVALVVTLINAQIFTGPERLPDLLALVAYCAAISGTVSIIISVLAPYASVAEPAVQPAAAPKRPAILDRLPVHLRGRLLYLSMQDHYVDVRTDRGNTLLLMRLGDAINETRGTPGLRIHRSHWVALDAVAGSTRRDGRPFVKMEDGELLPVSRSYHAAAKEAGIA